MRFWTKDITVDPSDPTESTWYVASFQGWGDFAVQGTGGLYKTKDKGLTWARISTEFRVNSATVHPRNPDLLYYTTETNGLWYSTNATAATPTFSRVASYPFRHPLRVFFNPYNLQEVWVASFGNGIKIGTDPSITIQTTPATPSVRGLYVDDFKNILGNTVKENQVLAYAQSKGFNYLALYELHYFDFNNATHRTNLASFIRRAKTTYGITQVAATGEIASFFRDRILGQYQATRTDALEKFDVLNLEFEFWSPVFTDAGGYYCTTYLQANNLICNRAGAFSFYMAQLTELKQLCLTNNLICETEFGWFTAAEATQFVPLSDRILVHAYVPKSWVDATPSTFYDYTKERLSFIAAASLASAPKQTMVILSSEPEFSGPWLTATNPPREPQAAFDLYKTSYDAETAAWRENISQVGYQWFTYSKMPSNGAVLPLELLDFEGTTNGKTNHLSWHFADAKELQEVTIEKSTDGKFFTPLSTIKNYELWNIPIQSGKIKNGGEVLDENPFELTYYRLKMNDLGGIIQYSKTIALTLNDKRILKILSVSPNPTDAYLTIRLEHKTQEAVTFSVFNVLGQMIFSEKTSASITEKRINTEGWSSGSYLLKINVGQAVEMVRFFKK